MTAIKRTGFAVLIMIIGAGKVMAIEEAKYSVLSNDDSFELRQYEPHVVAEIIVDGNLEDAGSNAFKQLFNYITGDNKSQRSLEMTAPVTQGAANEEIDMTAPVGQQRRDDKWAVSFMMPASYSLETLPLPDNPDVILRQVPARYMASIQYSGLWSEDAYLDHLDKLNDWIQKQNFKVTGSPVWARYNSPFSLWFLRRNEILIPVENPAKP